MQPFDALQPGRARNHRDVLPLLVTLQDFLWHSRELLVDFAVLVNAPHAAFWLCQSCSVKQMKFYTTKDGTSVPLSERNVSQMWVAHLGGDPMSETTRQQIVMRFTELYESAGMPDGVALCEITGTDGIAHGLCVTAKTPRYVQKLFTETTPWYLMEPPGNLGWAAGDPSQ